MLLRNVHAYVPLPNPSTEDRNPDHWNIAISPGDNGNAAQINHQLLQRILLCILFFMLLRLCFGSREEERRGESSKADLRANFREEPSLIKSTKPAKAVFMAISAEVHSFH